MLHPISTHLLDNKTDMPTNYTKITTNVYTFNTVTINAVNIHKSALYNQAIKKKHDGKNTEATELFKQYLLTDDIDDSMNKKYDIYINIALLSSDYDEIVSYYEKAINLCPDRSESYFYFGIYCNQHRKFEQAYELLTIAKNIQYDVVKYKYQDVKETAYGLYVIDELSVSCYWLKKYDEGMQHLTQIINMPYFKHNEARLKQNLEFFVDALASTG
jgi:tetratricopeptide (TPR) repeat protein